MTTISETTEPKPMSSDTQRTADIHALIARRATRVHIGRWNVAQSTRDERGTVSACDIWIDQPTAWSKQNAVGIFASGDLILGRDGHWRYKVGAGFQSAVEALEFFYQCACVVDKDGGGLCRPALPTPEASR